ncbi:helix-turn-helix domain-containing protein [Salmonella enterica subsp. enterica serovar Newport]|nr:helix-turn-helix transcriptional regulator [Salmonella enterica]EDL3488822.1 hypothetical protein [Salmonella enterica subsp. enterica serovar Newport]HED0311924.1 helix-turn-helix transcriptional regulator [Salmonella enterica subsp. enterica serovar Newport]
MFHTRLKKARDDKKLNQKTVCEKIGITVLTLQSWEKGKTEPKVSELIKLSDTYGVSIEELCNGIHTTINKKILLKMKEIENFTNEEKRCVDMILEALIIRHYTKGIKLLDEI